MTTKIECPRCLELLDTADNLNRECDRLEKLVKIITEHGGGRAMYFEIGMREEKVWLTICDPTIEGESAHFIVKKLADIVYAAMRHSS